MFASWAYLNSTTHRSDRPPRTVEQRDPASALLLKDAGVRLRFTKEEMDTPGFGQDGEATLEVFHRNMKRAVRVHRDRRGKRAQHCPDGAAKPPQPPPC